MISGWNLLNQVRGMIPSTTVKIRKVGTVSVNSMGYLVDARPEETTIAGCYIQPMNSAMYAQLGLQPAQNARVVFLPANVEGMESAAVDGDLLIFEGRNWRIVNDPGNWYVFDGWKMIAVVEDKQRNVL